MTRMSEKMMAASMRPAYRSMGCKVRVEDISGLRQHAKKSWFPLASWYSGRYLPAAVRWLQVSSPRESCVTLAHHPYGWSFHTFACSACELLGGDAFLAGIPLTALSSRSFCRGTKVDIVVVVTSVEKWMMHLKVMPSQCRTLMNESAHMLYKVQKDSDWCLNIDFNF